VLWQLANNAVKFTPRSGRVTLRVLRAGGAVRFDVEDTGEGIESDRLKRIFDGLGSSDNPLNHSTGGAGLGLSLARRLVAMHGGRIAAASAPGAGSRFWFTIPAWSPDAAPPAGGSHD
jgi:signal transduction histidine kinase